MGEIPHDRRAWYAARDLFALMTALALIVAPLVVTLTHGPAAHASALSITTEITAHGHHHSHSHSHIHDDAERDVHGDPIGGHDPADHDHPLYALVHQSANTPAPLLDKSKCVLRDVLRNITPEGQLRPPRFV